MLKWFKTRMLVGLCYYNTFMLSYYNKQLSHYCNKSDKTRGRLNRMFNELDELEIGEDLK